MSEKRTAGYILKYLAAVLLISLCFCSIREAQDHSHHQNSLGSVHFPVSCSEEAQVGFDRAVSLLHHMTYPQARTAFEQVASTDPKCAMAHWGIAMTLFQPLWPTRPGPDALRRGWTEVETAKSLSPRTEREDLFIAAAEAFFLEPSSSDYWTRIRRWERAMERVYASFPDDPEAAAFFALAHLAATPSDSATRANADRAAEILLRVYKKNPDHPGAMHYLVHANDVPGRERELLDITKKYESIAPDNPHAIHMPTHIYTRIGDWDGAIRGNLRAATAALNHPAGDKGQFVWDEFPHAIEYLVYAYLQKGNDDAAAAEIRRLRTTSGLEPTFKTAFHLMSTQARYALERRDWKAATMIVPREPAGLDWDKYAWPEAVAHFARGLGAAHLRKATEAEVSLTRLEQLEAAADKSGETLFARNIRVLQLELKAWIAFSRGRTTSSNALMREAVDIEASTPKHAVTPGPTLPANELLGDLLLDQGRSSQALDAYKLSLKQYPGRFNSLLGAARAARAVGDRSAANAFYRQLLQVTDSGSRREAVHEALDHLPKRERPGIRPRYS